MTLEKVAQRANVSLSTASKALHNAVDVAPQTRERVLQAAREIGYFAQKKRTAAANTRPEGLTFAVLCPEMTGCYYSDMVMLLAAEAEKQGCRTVIYHTGFERRRIEQQLRECAENVNLDAVINLQSIPECVYANISVIPNGGGSTSEILLDCDRIMCLAEEEIRRRGSKRVAFAGEKLTGGKQRAFRKHFHGEEFCSRFRYTEAGDEAAEHFLAGELPDCILCGYDDIALGVVDTLLRHGVRVPEDVGVIGMNDVPYARYCFGGLSTVRVEFSEVCSNVISDLLQDKKERVVRHHSYPAQISFIRRRT